jgi:hypothetical protein
MNFPPLANEIARNPSFSLFTNQMFSYIPKPMTIGGEIDHPPIILGWNSHMQWKYLIIHPHIYLIPSSLTILDTFFPCSFKVTILKDNLPLKSKLMILVLYLSLNYINLGIFPKSFNQGVQFIFIIFTNNYPNYIYYLCITWLN